MTRSKLSYDRTLMAMLLISLLGILLIGSGIFGFPAYAQQLAPVADPEFARSAIACPPKGITLDGSVVRVIDGDTIVVASTVEYHVRLLDCWAPESRTTDSAEKQRGLLSKARMQQLAAGKAVRVFLPGNGDVGEMITMGRVLGRVWTVVDNRPAPVDLSTIMVSERLATPEKQK